MDTTNICRSASCTNKSNLIDIKEHPNNPGQLGGRCPSCDKWTWIPMEKNIDKRPASQRGCKQFLERMGYDTCDMCGRHKDQLPEGFTLECNHMHQYAAGGKFDEYNIRPYCTGCHKLHHSLRHWIFKTSI